MAALRIAIVAVPSNFTEMSYLPLSPVLSTTLLSTQLLN
jgi:hypothetical protein